MRVPASYQLSDRSMSGEFVGCEGNILDCDQPLYEDPPKDLLAAQLPYPSGTCLQQRRQAWALCQVRLC